MPSTTAGAAIVSNGSTGSKAGSTPAKKTAPRKGTAKTAAAKKAHPPGAATPPRYCTSLWPLEREPLSESLGLNLTTLGERLGMPVWLLLQADSATPLATIDETIVHLIRHQRSLLPTEPVALVINSPGGSARCAYGLARILHRRCGGFTAVIPDAAMSAATLLTLGADAILMGPDASIGPLDAQIMDPEAETFSSALNEVQALERLRAYALESVDEAMQLLLSRTGKRVDTLLPPVLRFIADSMHPLLDKIDVVHYNERARILKVGEEYAVRLLRRRFPRGDGSSAASDPAASIAAQLVEGYPEHGFWIDRDEARTKLQLQIEETDEGMDDLLEALWEDIQGVTAVGQLQEVSP